MLADRSATAKFNLQSGTEVQAGFRRSKNSRQSRLPVSTDRPPRPPV